METPPALRDAAGDRDDVTLTRREYGDETVIAVDFGPGAEPSLDVVGDLAIVVFGGRQFEFPVPPDAADVALNDGMLTIRG